MILVLGAKKGERGMKEGEDGGTIWALPASPSGAIAPGSTSGRKMPSSPSMTTSVTLPGTIPVAIAICRRELLPIVVLLLLLHHPLSAGFTPSTADRSSFRAARAPTDYDVASAYRKTVVLVEPLQFLHKNRATLEQGQPPPLLADAIACFIFGPVSLYMSQTEAAAHPGAQQYCLRQPFGFK